MANEFNFEDALSETSALGGGVDDTQSEAPTQFNFEEATAPDIDSTMREAVKIDPAHQARVVDLSRKTGVPQFAVEDNPDAVESQMKSDEMDFSKATPVVADFLNRDFNNAIIAQEDASTGLLDDIAKVLSFTGTSLYAGVYGGISAPAFGALETGVDVVRSFTTKPLRDIGILPADPLEPLAELLGEQFRSGKALAADIAPEPTGTLLDAVSGGLQSVPASVASLLTLNPTAALSSMGALAFGASAAEAKEQGLPVGQTVVKAATDAVIEVASEKIPAFKLIEDLGLDQPFAKSMFNQLVAEIPGEQAATLLQDFNSWAFLPENKDKTFLEYTEERPSAALNTLVATIVGTGVQTSAVVGVHKTISKLTQTEQVKQSQSDVEQGNIDKLSADAAKSKLREHDVESFKQFVREADGDNNTHVFIDGAQTALYLQSKTQEEIESDSALKTLNEALIESRVTGTDVAVPVDQFMGEVAGSDSFGELREHMTMSEESASPFRQEQHKIETEAYVETLMTEAESNASEYVEAQELFNTVRDQLVDTGAVTPANASIMAQVVPAWATAQAKRSGRSVAEVYESAGLTIEGPQTGELARLQGEQVLSQEFVPVVDQQLADDLINEISEVSEVSDEGIVTVYHRTTEENAKQIREAGSMTSLEDGLFFSTKRDGQAEGFGDGVVEFKIPADQLQLDDIFDDEAHLRLPVKTGELTDVTGFLTQVDTVPQSATLDRRTDTREDSKGQRVGDDAVIDPDLYADTIAREKIQKVVDMIPPGVVEAEPAFVRQLIETISGDYKELGKAERDELTNFFNKQYTSKAIDRAINAVKDDPSKIIGYAGIDIANLGGMNAFFNNNNDNADVVLAGMLNVLDTAMKDKLPEGTKVTAFKDGGDEFAFIADGATAEQLEAAIIASKEDIVKYFNETTIDLPDGSSAELKKLNDLPNPKQLGEKLEAEARKRELDYELTPVPGVSLYVGTVDLDADDTAVEVRGLAALKYDAEKDQRMGIREEDTALYAHLNEVENVTDEEIESSEQDVRGREAETDEGIGSENGRGTGRDVSPDGDQASQETTFKQNNLVVTHNLSAENILAAADLGGLAAPSIATIRTDISDFDNFGEVSLLADPSLLESNKARTFDADIYSPRQPRPVHDINLDKFSQFRERLSDLGLTNPDIQSLESGAEALQRSNAVQYLWLEEQGKAPKPKNKKVSSNVKKATKILGKSRNPVARDFFKDEKMIKLAEAEVRAGYEGLPDAVKDNVADRYFEINDADEVDFDVVAPRRVIAFIEKVISYHRNPIDSHQLRNDIDKKLRTKKASDAYDQWVTEQYNDMVDGKKLFKGFTNSGNRRYSEYNMQNVVKEMTQQLQAGESSFYGAGTVRSKYANEMKTVKQVQAKRDDIVSEADMQIIKDESASVFEDAMDSLKPHYKFDAESWGFMEDAGSAIIEGPKGLREAFNMTPEVTKIVNDLVSYLAALPSSYFETKIQRAVDFSEFNTAVVPKGMDKKALQVLKDAGLKIKTYDPKGEGKTRQQVISEQKKLLFQDNTDGARGYYDPSNSIIRLTESADLSTFLHEFAHFMYEMEASGNTDMNQSINNWYKRNAEDVAKEAGTYAPNTTIIPKHVREFLDNGTTGDKERDVAIRRAVHEQFARGFETYLMEGKAPSIELRNAFRAFARWLSQIYQAMRGDLNVNLDNEMREVFDRLLATEEQIAAAESRARVEPMFTDAAMAGMTDKEFADYQSRQEKVKDVQSETLREKLIKQLTRQTKAWWKDEKSDLFDTEMDRLKKERVYATATRLKHVGSTVETEADITELKKDIIAVEKDIKKITKDNDTIGQLLAKSGGLDREMMEADGIDPANFKTRGKVFGKPLFPKTGGMTIDDVIEILGEHGVEVDSNEAIDLINEVVDDDTQFVNPDVSAEIDLLEDDISKLESQVQELDNKLEFVNLKLDHATVKEMVGVERTNKLGRTSTHVSGKLRGMTAKGQKGVHPDEAATFFGYNSGAEMLNDLMTAPAMKEAADTAAQAQMIERHGDILTDGTLEQQADEAVQNEERGKLILHELKILARGTNQRNLDRQTVKSISEEKISQLSYKEIHPGKYRKAEIRAAQESARMLAEGNKEGAAQAKARQVLNYYLGMAATDARANTVKIVDRMSRYNKKKVREEIIKSDGGHWEQITKILERFEFRKSKSIKSVDDVNQDINTWAKERMDLEGDGLVLHNVVLNESYVTHWKNVAYGDLQGINDSVKNIEHVARYANKLTLMGEEIEYNKLVDELVTVAAETGTGRFVKKASVADDLSWIEKKGRWAMAQMTKIPYMMSWMDGSERAGTWFNVISQPFTTAYNDELEMFAEVGQPIVDMIDDRSKEDMKRHNTTFFIPEIKGTGDGTHTGNLKGHEIVAVALNTGNAGNLRKLLLGEGWATEENDADINLQNPKLQAVLQHLTKSDWEMVQQIWDQIDILYPKLAEVHRRTTGLTPPKVEATPVETSHGTFKGGYYPVKYDPTRDNKAAEFEERKEAEVGSMFASNASIQSSVNAGATNERTGYYAPMHLTMSIIPNHIQETIHFITHHDAVRDVNRLLRDPRIKKSVTEKLGPEEFAQLKPWLNDIAKDGRNAPNKSMVDAMFNKLRLGTTLGVMGFKASTGIIQVSGLSNTIAEVGMGPVMQSMRTILGSTESMQSAWEYAIENSKVLKHRTKTMDREIMNAMQQLESKRGVLAAVQETSMKHIALIQTYMVDLPSWHAAYIKEMSASGDETKAFQYADWVIENVQGSGATKDMAALMRNQSKTHTIFTMFMTFFSSLWNMERDLVKGAKSGAYSTTTVAAKTMFLFTLPVLFEMIMRGEFSTEEGDEDELLQTMMTKVALYPIASVPFVRDIANGVFGGYGYNASPVTSVVEQGLQGLKGASKATLADDEITKGQAKAISKFAGVTVGLPGTGQAWATGEHLYDVMVEGEEFTTHQLLFGPKRD